MEYSLEQMRQNVAEIREKMKDAALAAGRDPKEVLLCAASKTRSVETVAAANGLDIDVFGENYVQELIEKFDAGAYGIKPAHLIGHLQTNKVKYVVGRAALIHSVDSEKLLLAVDKEAAKKGLVQDVLFEVNIGGEWSKSGITPETLWPLAESAAALEHIRVRGLMAIPPVNDDDAENRRVLAKMFDLYRRLDEKRYQNAKIDTLSMGMSGDFENAIREGATVVRIGTSIFGERYYPPKNPAVQ